MIFFSRENCHYKTFKLVKKLIRRPKFLSPSIELIGNNMIFLSKGYNQKEFFPVSLNVQFNPFFIFKIAEKW